VTDLDLTESTKPIEAFQDAVKNCSPGEKIIYHRGAALAGSTLARVALSAFEANQVELVQRRNRAAGKSVFDFIAVKKRKIKSGFAKI